MIKWQEVTCTLGQMVKNGSLQPVRDTSTEDMERIAHLEISADDYFALKDKVKYLGITEEFRKVIRTLGEEGVRIPAGFRPELTMGNDDALLVDLKRDISYGENGRKRPTKYLFSADSANPYEVAPLKNIIANLTCNPAIIYNLFINNPKVNVGNRFKDRYEVIAEIAKTLGSGADISVEVDNPFAPESAILEEIARFEEILTPYRLVVKVPHTGPTNAKNIQELAGGRFSKGYLDGTVEDNLYGHNLAYTLQKKGYRINFTLMGEPHQTAIALQVRPYFINSFIKMRLVCSKEMDSLVKAFEVTGDQKYLVSLRTYLLDHDHLPSGAEDMDLLKVLKNAKDVLSYRGFHGHEGRDGLDSARHSLRLLKNSNLEDTRLILCSMDNEIYPSIDKMLMEPEFADVLDRVVITAPPSYLAQHASATTVVSYQRTFVNAVK